MAALYFVLYWFSRCGCYLRIVGFTLLPESECGYGKRFAFSIPASYFF